MIAKMRTLIKNAVIIDGTGAGRFPGELLTEGDTIAKIGRKIECSPDRTVDAGGKILCPGFVDTHSHTDLQILRDPFPAPKLLQGITTEIYGQDGVSMAPLPPEYIHDFKKILAGLEGTGEISWNYRDTAGYLGALEKRGISINAGYLAPHGNVRMEVMGLADRAPAPQELERMKDVLRRELQAGAMGMSTGLIYIPCAYSHTSELTELCKVVAEFGGVFVVHQRSEADNVLESMREILDVARGSGVHAHFSHFKACGRNAWDKIPQMLALLDRAHEEGLNITFDQYPYVAGSTALSVVLPPWVQADGASAMLRRIADEGILKKIQADIDAGSRGWDNFADFAGWDGIFVTYAGSGKNQALVGKSLAEIAKLWDTDPLHATARLLIEENNAVSMVDFYGKEDHVKLFLTRPEQNVCTDGILSGTPHPRVYGTCARILGKYVREEKTLTLEEAVKKLSFNGARVMGIRDRGLLKEGYKADLVIFDPDTVAETGTFTEPCRHPDGFRLVMVNGEAVLDGNGIHRLPAGRVLYRRNT